MTEFEVLDPATARRIATIEDMDQPAIDAVVARAREVFDDGRWWPGTPDDERGRVLARLAELVRAQADELARLESLDVGKPIAEAEGDIAEVANILEYYAGWPGPGHDHGAGGEPGPAGARVRIHSHRR